MVLAAVVEIMNSRDLRRTAESVSKAKVLIEDLRDTLLAILEEPENKITDLQRDAALRSIRRLQKAGLV